MLNKRAVLEMVSSLIDDYSVDLCGETVYAAIAVLRATGTSTTHYPSVLGYTRNLAP